MNDKEISLFIDRLTGGSELARAGEPMGLDEEARQIEALWTELGQLEPAAAGDEAFVSNFKEKANAYREGWQMALLETKSSHGTPPTRSASRRRLFRYGWVAGVAAVVALTGLAGRWVYLESEALKSELGATREALALTLLDEVSAPRRLAGLQAASKIDHPSAALRRTLTQALNSDDNLNVRLAAVGAISSLPRDEALSLLLRRFEDEESILVQMEIVRHVMELVSEEHRPALVARLESLPMEPRVRAYLQGNAQRI